MITKSVTSLFMLPTVSLDKGKLKVVGFINAYIRDAYRDDHYSQDVIYLLFKPTDVDLFREFLSQEYENSEDIVEDYDYENGYVVVVYKLNPDFKEDFELVKKGLYSHTSFDFKEKFAKTVKIVKYGKEREEPSLQFRIFNKTPDLIKFWENKLGVVFDDELEVWEGFHESNEVLDIEKIKIKEYEKS